MGGLLLYRKESILLLAKKLARDQYISNADIHRATGLDQSTISKIMNGRTHPYPVQAKKIALALGYTGNAEELFSEVYNA